MVWRRLDAPGHDACRLLPGGSGWILEGTAVFVENGSPASLAYRVTCDARWQTREGEVRGWIGGKVVRLAIVRSEAGAWTVNGAAAPAVTGLHDLDLGFTPATNLLQLRRVALAVGQAADVPVAWMDGSTDTLDVVPQRYERRGEALYWYESPRFGYSALLEVGPAGFVRRYPDLWEAVV